MKKKLLLTGGAGFIGANFVKTMSLQEDVRAEYDFVILDALTYAGNYQTIEQDIKENDHLSFVNIDIRDHDSIDRLFAQEKFAGVLHFAAESHVDNSISNPNIFVETNVIGTLNLLNAANKYASQGSGVRFLSVSTDEVYGQLKESEPAFTENHPLRPNSPYSASKASADLLALSYFETYNLNVVITRCSNNYGPYQYPEKLIPLMVNNAIREIPLPVYGDGKNIRDWIYVDDHNRGIWTAFQKGRAGECYNFGGNSEKRNLDVVKAILKGVARPESLISFVTDRKGHDWRYAIDYTKANKELGWEPSVQFEEGISRTINWYLENIKWCDMVGGD